MACWRNRRLKFRVTFGSLTAIFAFVARRSIVSSIGNACARTRCSKYVPAAVLAALLPKVADGYRDHAFSDDILQQSEQEVHASGDDTGMAALEKLIAEGGSEEDIVQRVYQGVQSGLLTLPKRGQGLKHQALGGEPSLSEAPYEVTFDGDVWHEVKRQPRDELLQESYYEIPLEGSGITVDEERVARRSVYIPSASTIKSTQYRDMRVIDMEDFGISHMVWGPNPHSLFSDSAKVGSADKYHIVYRTGRVDSASLTFATKQYTAQDAETKITAAQFRAERSRLLLLYLVALDFGPQLLGSAVETTHVRRTKVHTVSHPTLNKDVQQRMIAMKEKHDKVKHAMESGEVEQNILSSWNHCMHFEDQPGVGEIDGKIKMPLGKAIVTYRGQMTLAPLQRTSLLIGLGYFMYDEAEQILKYYHKASVYLDVVNPYHTNEYPITYYVSPPGGGLWLSEEERNQDTRKMQNRDSFGVLQWATIKLFRKLYQDIPPDYQFYFGYVDHICSGKTKLYKDLDEGFRNLGVNALVQFLGVSKLEQLRKGKSFLQLMTDSVACSGPFMRAPIRHSHSFDLFEGMLWMHFLSETPAQACASWFQQQWNP